MTKSQLLKHTLFRLHLPRNKAGYMCICEALDIVLEDENALLNLSRNVYPIVAQRLKSTPRCVERNLRTAAKICWREGDQELLEQIFGGHTGGNVPSAGIYITYLAMYIKDTPCEEQSVDPAEM